MYLEKFRLDGRVAVITGAARGIGLAIAQALGEAGASVVVGDINTANGQRAVGGLQERGIRASFRLLDVTDSKAVDAAVREIEDNIGAVDILVNNAGIARNIDAVDYGDADYQQLMRVNLDGVFYCCRAFGRPMLARGRGSVVNIGSMSGIAVNKPQPQAPYNFSKAAVHMLTKSLACEWAPKGVRVNAVAPGYVETEMTVGGRENADWNSQWLQMTPMGRHAQVDEIAAGVLFLASDAASFCTGTVLSIDGGYTAW